MLEWGGLAHARPIHVKQQCTISTCNHNGTRMAHVVQGYEVLVTAYLKHPNRCGPYFKRFLPVLAYLGETHDTAVGSPKQAAQN